MPSRVGFALVEVLIAALVFALGALVLTKLHAALVRHAHAAHQRSLATQLAQAKLDELRAALLWLPAGAAWPTGLGEGGVDGCSGRDTPGTDPASSFERRWQIRADRGDPGLRRIDVQVGWTDRDGQPDPAGVQLGALLATRDPTHTAHAAHAEASNLHDAGGAATPR